MEHKIRYKLTCQTGVHLKQKLLEMLLNVVDLVKFSKLSEFHDMRITRLMLLCCRQSLQLKESVSIQPDSTARDANRNAKHIDQVRKL